MASPFSFSDSTGGFRHNSPTGLSTRQSEPWPSVTSLAEPSEGNERDPTAEAAQKLIEERGCMEKELKFGLFSGAEQSEALKFAKMRAQTIKPSLGPISPFSPRQLRWRNDRLQSSSPLPDIRRISEEKDAVSEIYRLRSRLRWKTRPLRSGKEENSDEKDEAKKIAKQLAGKDVQPVDDGEFVCCIANSLSEFNPYDLTVVSSEKAKTAIVYYTITATAVTQLVRGCPSDIVLSQRWLWEKKIFENLIKIKTFAQFRLWKVFNAWRSVVSSTKVSASFSMLTSGLSSCDSLLASGVIAVQSLCEDFCTSDSSYGFYSGMKGVKLVSVDEDSTYSLKALLEKQNLQLAKAKSGLEELRGKVIKIIKEKCYAVVEREGIGQALSEVQLKVEQKEDVVYVEDKSAKGGTRKITLKPLRPKPCYADMVHWKNALQCVARFIHRVDLLLLELLRRLVHKGVEALLYYVIRGAANWRAKDSARLLEEIEINPEMITPNIRLEFEKSLQSMIQVDLLGEIKRKTVKPLLKLRLMLDVSKTALSPSTYLVPSVQQLISSANILTSELVALAMQFEPIRSSPELEIFLNPPFTKIRNTRYSRIEGPDVGFLFASDDIYQSMTEEIKKCIKANAETVVRYCKKFQQYNAIITEAKTFDVDVAMVDVDWNPHKVESVFIKYHEDIARIRAMEAEHRVGFLVINASEFQATCLPYPQAVISRLQQILPPVAAQKNDALLKQLKETNELLSVKSSSVPEFVNRLALLSRLAGLLPDWERDYTVVCQLYAVGMQYKAAITAEEHALHLTLSPAFTDFKTKLNDAEADRPDEILKFSSTLDDQIVSLWKEVLDLKSDIQNPALLDAETVMKRGVQMVGDLDDRLRGLDSRARTCAEYQRRFGSTPASVRIGKLVRKLRVVVNIEIEEIQLELSHMTRNLSLKNMAWHSIKEWNEVIALWEVTSLDSLDIDEVQQTVAKMTQTHYLLEKTLPRCTLIPMFSSSIADFKSISPVVIAICSPALRDRHWDMIKDCVGQKIVRGKGLNINKLQSMNVFSHRERILEIENQASNEAAVEHMLQKIADTWLTAELSIAVYKNQKDVFIIGGSDDLGIALEESLLTMTIIRGSPYVGPIKHAVDDWSRRLNLFSHTLEQWLTCQRKWIYLESIFSATDIQRQLPNEYHAFSQADKSWKEIMRMTVNRPNAVRAACVPGVLESLQSNNAHLDRIQKCLEDYLETKRIAFPRFYFLSNDELLDTLSNSRNPNAVQGHLAKCFTNVRQLEMTGGDQQAALTIQAMVSAEGESVALTKNLRARGHVETWLAAVELAMFSVIRKSLKESLADYREEKRLDWVLRYPGQVTLTSSQIIWTHEVIQCIQSSSPRKALLNLKSRWISHLNDLAQLIYMPLRLYQEEAVISLVTIDVHCRDIITFLIDNGVCSEGDFGWTRQIRYTWDKDADTCFIHQGSMTLEYGCEYLGCPPRLVVTPLTDRCYLTLMGALRLNLGGSPAGPAGTGKTETVKDLAKAVGKHCFVFNCSEGLNYQMMGRFFSGMVQCGSWCCLDEFNRIDVEVLSVIAQQLRTIKTAKDRFFKTFYFEGREMKLKRDCCPFITMNPGYAGRVELPDNLKSLFRPVAMTIPDNEMIAEIVLYSQGFASAAILSRKIVKLYELASQQMSKEHHYDFGLRAIKLVLVVAGSYKKADKRRSGADFESETQLLIQALRDANRPKLHVDDAHLLDQFITDLFPGITLKNSSQSTVLKIASELCLHHSSLEEWPSLVEKCDQLYKTLRVRHGVMLVGPTGGGKTTARQTLAQALNVLHSEKTDQSHQRPRSRSSLASSRVGDGETNKAGRPGTSGLLRLKGAVEVLTVYPRSVTLSELYGQLNADTLEWMDGLLSHAVRQFSQDAAEASMRKMQGKNRRPSIASAMSDSSRPNTPYPGVGRPTADLANTHGPPVYGPSVKRYVDNDQISWDDVEQFVSSDRVVAPVGWRWLVLDGPVDTLWVENLNTTLDDTKVLCLSSGERIALGTGVRLLFEVDDLSHASLSTVSRCSMVYMDPADLGWRPYVKSWSKSLPSNMPKSGVQHILALFEQTVNPGLDFLKSHQHNQFLVCPDLSVVSTLCSILSSILTFISSRGGFSVFSKEQLEEQSEQSESEEGETTFRFESIFSPAAMAHTSPQVTQRLTYLQRHPDHLFIILGRLFVFSYTWSFGGMLVDDGYSEEGDGLADFTEYQSKSSSQSFIARGSWGGGPRAKFDAFLHKVFECDPPLGVRLPPSPQTMFAFYVDLGSGNFKKWEDLVPTTVAIIDDSSATAKTGRPLALLKRKSPLTFTYQKDEIGVVPTVDTLRYSFLINLLMMNNRPLLFTGDLGVGKTMLINYALSSLEQDGCGIVASVFGGILGMSGMLPSEIKKDGENVKIQSKNISLSAFVTTKRLQTQMEKSMVKLGKGSIGAESDKRLVLFLDDVNVVQPNQFGVHLPLEVLRQLVDAGGFHDTKKFAWKNVSGVTPVVGCGPLRGKSHSFSPRLLRHFGVVNYCHPGTLTMQHIYEVVLGVFLERSHFAKRIFGYVSSAVSAAIYVYQCMVTQLKPTPSKYHYCFNMRDLSKVILGIFQVQPAVVTSIEVFNDLVSHESERVFADRLVDAKDRDAFYSSLADAQRINFKKALSADKLKSERVIFASVLNMDRSSSTRQYSPSTDISKLGRVLDETLVRMNMAQSKNERLVFFKEAVEHTLRCVRVFQQSSSHILMIGVGGVGKKSLCRLAAFICQYECRTMSKSGNCTREDFKEDLRKLYKDIGLAGKPAVFLLTDAHLFNEEIVEDLNELMTSGEVYDLFEAEELELLLAEMKSEQAGKSESRDDLYEKFTQNVKRNLHICLAMSPAQSRFFQRCLLYPALMRACTLDWYEEWPPIALQSVARSFFQTAGLKVETNEPLLNVIASVCVAFHQSVGSFSLAFLEEMNRRHYTTPTAFLHFVNLFVLHLKKNRDGLVRQRKRLQTGLDCLSQARSNVNLMQKEMENLRPVIVQKAKATDTLLQELAHEQEGVDKERGIVQKEESKMAEKTCLIEENAMAAQKDLDDALPALQTAVFSLDALDRTDIAEIRVYTKPPEMVMNVMAAVCVLLKQKPDWSTAKQLLADPGFLSTLVSFDKNNVSDKVHEEVKRYTSYDGFSPSKIGRVSVACRSICAWVLALQHYVEVFKIVEPKKKKCFLASEELKSAQAELREKQKHLQKIEDEFSKLKDKYNESVMERDKLKKKQKQTHDRIDRACILVSALAEEEVRWSLLLSALEGKLHCLQGDSLFSAASLTYLGPFTSSYRQHITSSWQQSCLEHNVAISQECSMISSLTTGMQIETWRQQGLPLDNHSTENAILVTHKGKWPLIIDPQGQARKWIEALEKPSGLVMVDVAEASYLQTIERAIQLGQPVLLHNVGESVDSCLEPILRKDVVQRGAQNVLCLGNQMITYSSNFRLYLCTSLANPVFSPELSTLVSVVNFSIAFEALKEQLLSDIVLLECPVLEEQRANLIEVLASDRGQLSSLEDRMLDMLQSVEGHILDKQELVQTLQKSKTRAEELSSRVNDRRKTQQQIGAARDQYLPVATRGSTLYFVISELSRLNVMYHFSLDWFKNIFSACCKRQHRYSDVAHAPLLKDLGEYLNQIVADVTLTTYQETVLGMFAQHHLSFSFLLCCSILNHESGITDSEWRLFLQGSMYKTEIKGPAPSPPKSRPPTSRRLVSVASDIDEKEISEAKIASNSVPSWMAASTWKECLHIEATVPVFSGLCSLLKSDTDFATGFQESCNPYDYFFSQTVDPFWRTLSSFQRLLLVKTMRPQFLLKSIRQFISVELGHQFVSSPVAELIDVANKASPWQPIILILSPGCDPARQLLSLSQREFGPGCLEMISLGRGQGSLAKESIQRSAISNQKWVFLQNCHLATSWMPALENLVTGLSTGSVKPTFRLWLSSLPDKAFPQQVLRRSIKVTVEPPDGIQANLSQSVSVLKSTVMNDNPSDLDEKQRVWCQLFYSVCLFHAVVVERKKFGSLGWNLAYEFTTADLEVAVQILRESLVSSGGEVPWEALRCLTGDVVYGGRVTDEWDRRCVKELLAEFYSEKIESKCFMNCQSYPTLPDGLCFDNLSSHIESLPLVDQPQILGLHPSVEEIRGETQRNLLLDSILRIQPQTSHKQRTSTEILAQQLARDIFYRLPDNITELDVVRIENSTDFLDFSRTTVKDSKQRRATSDPLETILYQEIRRFNVLLSIVRHSLKCLMAALKGEEVMSDALQATFESLSVNQVPSSWSQHSYVSCMPLGTWTDDLIRRVSFFRYWALILHPSSDWNSVSSIDSFPSREGSTALSALKAVAASVSHPETSLNQLKMPSSLWLSAFFFPKGLLIAVLQSYGRKHGLPIDELDFSHQVAEPIVHSEDHPPSIPASPEDGVCVHGLFLEAASWNNGMLTDLTTSKYVEVFPQIHFIPRKIESSPTSEQIFQCPLYQSSKRGMANCVSFVNLPTTEPAHYWILRGTALVCQADH
eukprot:m.162667 g.162667  ORF g.162667 m.162667 type:complete len:4507 (+) comp38847_c0_seq1:65-13585(+)